MIFDEMDIFTEQELEALELEEELTLELIRDPYLSETWPPDLKDSLARYRQIRMEMDKDIWDQLED